MIKVNKDNVNYPEKFGDLDFQDIREGSINSNISLKDKIELMLISSKKKFFQKLKEIHKKYEI